MEIHAGSGGDDSKLFVHDLFAAYAKYAETSMADCELLDSSHGQVTARVSGKNIGALLGRESGQHCVQRIPPTESKGRRQTSYVMVAVLPMPAKSERVTLLPESELNVTTMRGSGPGGQHRNKTESCVKMVHKPTGMAITIDGRDQHANRREAHRILSVKVFESKSQQTSDQYSKLRRDQLGNGSRGDKVRTYNFIQSRAVDHRTGKKTSAVEQVIGKGRFDLLM